jgi:hypothetical protein
VRILFLWQYYDRYIRQFYARRPGLPQRSYLEQHMVLLDDYFGWPGYLVRALGTLGHKADIIYGNVEPLQAAWAREHDVPYLFPELAFYFESPNSRVRGRSMEGI